MGRAHWRLCEKNLSWAGGRFQPHSAPQLTPSMAVRPLIMNGLRVCLYLAKPTKGFTWYVISKISDKFSWCFTLAVILLVFSVLHLNYVTISGENQMERLFAFFFPPRQYFIEGVLVSVKVNLRRSDCVKRSDSKDSWVVLFSLSAFWLLFYLCMGVIKWHLPATDLWRWNIWYWVGALISSGNFSHSLQNKSYLFTWAILTLAASAIDPDIAERSGRAI